jgi:putative ABC transport system permease protein
MNPNWKQIVRGRLEVLRLPREREIDIVEELALHLEAAYEEALADGLSEAEAEARAVQSYDWRLLECELSRAERPPAAQVLLPSLELIERKGGIRMESFIQDLRFGVRILMKNRGFTLIAVLTLALGIGANTAIFSIVNGVLLKPLPYDEPDRLVWLSEYTVNSGEGALSYPNFADWRAQNRVFEKIGVYNDGDYNLTGGVEAERLRAAQMSADLFAALRVNAALGRVYTNDEDKPGASPVVVLSQGLWQRRFGGDPNIVGRTITLNDRGYTVVGVMPQGFAFPARVEMWVPVGPFSDQELWKLRANHPGLYAVARLKPGVTIEQARADMKNVTAALEKQYPDTNQGSSATIKPLLENYVSGIRRTLYVLFGAVSFVLLIACANVAGLALGRTAARQKETAVRSALGASRWRIVRQLLTESVLLASLSGVLGWLIAQWGIKAILAISPEGAIPRVAEIDLDKSVLLFTAAVSILTGVLFGLAPALQSSRPDLQEALKETARSTTGRRHWLRSGIVVTEIALTLVLLVGAGLLIRSFYRLQQVHPGFATESTLRFKVSLPEQKYPDAELDKRINFFNQLKEKVEALPGVQSVGLSSGLPLGHNGWQTSFTLVGRPDPPLSETPSMEACVADIGYFETLRIPLVRGRFFNEHDNRSHLRPEDLKGKATIQQIVAGLRTIIIDEEFARRHFPGEDPIGRQIRLGRSSDPWATPMTVVGVVGRVKMEGLRNNSDNVQGYFPFRQFPSPSMIYTVRTQLAPEHLTASLRRQVQEVDPNQPIFDVSTLDETRAESIAPERSNLVLIGIFAAVALVLALVGIYGVVAWSVTQRTHEIGVRMALGAQTGDVMRLILRQGVKLVSAGIGLGLAGAFALTRLMKALLFEVSATDPPTLVSITLLLVGVALLACFAPARRATKVDPLTALRHE